MSTHNYLDKAGLSIVWQKVKDAIPVAASASPQNVSTTSSIGTSTSYARQDHVHKITLASGDSNGQVKIAGSNVSVKGLGTAAYTSSGAYAAATAISAMVTGPTSVTSGNVAIFNGTGGKAIKDSGFTIGKSVPSDAVFTDTDTKVTSAANHYSPATASGSAKTASATGATAAWGIDVVKGITIDTDGKGHITGLSVTSGKIPANPNTDVKVTQTVTTAGNTDSRPVLLGYSSVATATTDPTFSTVTNTAYAAADVFIRPSIGQLNATSYQVNAGVKMEFDTDHKCLNFVFN